MSNTGRNKKLASFNCEDLWSSFIRRCQEQGTTATTILTRFIELYLDGELDLLDVEPLGARFEQRVEAIVEQYLQQHLPSHLDKSLAPEQEHLRQLYSSVVSLSQKLGSLEERLNTINTRSYPKKTNPPPKEREFWFIQDRARYLGYSISANQRIKIEMFANDAYQKRHGKPPLMRLYRGSQAFAYPAADLDILDNTIKGVVRQG